MEDNSDALANQEVLTAGHLYVMMVHPEAGTITTTNNNNNNNNNINTNSTTTTNNNNSAVCLTHPEQY